MLRFREKVLYLVEAFIVGFELAIIVNAGLRELLAISDLVDIFLLVRCGFLL